MNPFTSFDDGDAQIVLRRLDNGSFALVERLRYQDGQYGMITIPPDLDPGPGAFETDFASLPWFTRWFIPPLGTHLPASILHDALTGDGPPFTYQTRDGHVIGQTGADRVYLDAMRVSGVSLIRRRIMWSAVSVHAGARRSPLRFLAWLAVLFVVVGVAVLEVTDSFAIGVLPWFDRSGSWGFAVEWLQSIPLVAAVMALAAVVLLPRRYVGPAIIQSLVFGLLFLPVAFMIPGWILLEVLPNRSGPK